MCSKCHWTILSQRSCVRGERSEIVCAEGSSRRSALRDSKKWTAINTKSLQRPAPRSVESHEDGLISSFGNRDDNRRKRSKQFTVLVPALFVLRKSEHPQCFLARLRRRSGMQIEEDHCPRRTGIRFQLPSAAQSKCPHS